MRNPHLPAPMNLAAESMSVLAAEVEKRAAWNGKFMMQEIFIKFKITSKPGRLESVLGRRPG